MVQLEDQTFPKRCGHLDGKGVIPRAEMRGKLRAALDARHSADTLILARTDAVAVEGFEAAMERAEDYLACGVDALFIEALRTPEQMLAACERFAGRIPLLANMVEGGKTPVKAANELGRLGFRIVIFPGGTARAVAHTLQRYFGSLKQHETTAPERERMLDFDQLNALIGTPELLRQAARYDASAQQE
jgi:2-methylisocitrate lyase-like PEP mutase family enzyme